MAFNSGTLVREGNCLYLDNGGPNPRDLLALPEDASWDDGSQTLTLDGNHYVVGSTITVGGGESNTPIRSDWAVPPDSSCDISPVWWVGQGLPNGYPNVH